MPPTYYALLTFCFLQTCTALSRVRGASVAQPHSSDPHIAGSVPFTKDSVEQPAPKHLAILISGQLSRFVYRDSLRNVSGGISWLLCGTLPVDQCTVDVYIVLANTSRKAGYGLYDGSPPYGDNAFTEKAIQQFYRQNGAHRVFSQVLSNSTLERTFTDVERLIKQSRAQQNGDADHWWNSTQKLPRISRRWGNNGRMFLLRHAVYAKALEAERQLPYNYSHFLYMREDNVFVDPSTSFEALSRRAQAQGWVAVDKYCGWNTKSDKIYFADRRGADVLFGPMLSDHVRRMTMFLSRGLRLHEQSLAEASRVNSIKKWTMGLNDPLQSESFVDDLLNSSGATVATYDFSRTEIRYHKGTPCVFEIYFKCTREPGKVFRKCECPYCT